MKKRITLKRLPNEHYTTYPIYEIRIDTIPIVKYCISKKNVHSLFKRYELGLKKLPKDAKLLLTKEQRAPYDKMLLGGWVCTRLSFTYGIYLSSQDRILTQPEECLYWELTDEEIYRFTNYPKEKEDDADSPDLFTHDT
jgi:hypothetical protein